MPKAAALGRVRGIGPFALLSCKDGGSRYVHLFEDSTSRSLKLWKWDKTGCGPNCSGDHILLELKSRNALCETDLLSSPFLTT